MDENTKEWWWNSLHACVNSIAKSQRQDRSRKMGG